MVPSKHELLQGVIGHPELQKLPDVALHRLIYEGAVYLLEEAESMGRVSGAALCWDALKQKLAWLHGQDVDASLEQLRQQLSADFLFDNETPTFVVFRATFYVGGADLLPREWHDTAVHDVALWCERQVLTLPSFFRHTGMRRFLQKAEQHFVSWASEALHSKVIEETASFVGRHATFVTSAHEADRLIRQRLEEEVLDVLWSIERAVVRLHRSELERAEAEWPVYDADAWASWDASEHYDHQLEAIAARVRKELRHQIKRLHTLFHGPPQQHLLTLLRSRQSQHLGHVTLWQQHYESALFDQ